MIETESAAVILAQSPPFTLGALNVRPATREVEAAEFRDVLEPRVMQVLVALARAGHLGVNERAQMLKDRPGEGPRGSDESVDPRVADRLARHPLNPPAAALVPR